jgi:hypothetical protein
VGGSRSSTCSTSLGTATSQHSTVGESVRRSNR